MSYLEQRSLVQKWTVVALHQLEQQSLGLLMMVLLITQYLKDLKSLTSTLYTMHAFAVEWWYKADHDQGYFGKPTQVWKSSDYKPCGTALFIPVQRIWQTFACCSMKIKQGCEVELNVGNCFAAGAAGSEGEGPLQLIWLMSEALPTVLSLIPRL